MDSTRIPTPTQTWISSFWIHDNLLVFLICHVIYQKPAKNWEGHCWRGDHVAALNFRSLWLSYLWNSSFVGKLSIYCIRCCPGIVDCSLILQWMQPDQWSAARSGANVLQEFLSLLMLYRVAMKPRFSVFLLMLLYLYKGYLGFISLTKETNYL